MVRVIGGHLPDRKRAAIRSRTLTCMGTRNSFATQTKPTGDSTFMRSPCDSPNQRFLDHNNEASGRNWANG